MSDQLTNFLRQFSEDSTKEDIYEVVRELWDEDLAAYLTEFSCEPVYEIWDYLHSFTLLTNYIFREIGKNA